MSKCNIVSAIAKAKLELLRWFTKHHEGNKVTINQGTEVFMRNVVLDGVKEILQTYCIKKFYSTAYSIVQQKFYIKT